LQVSLNASIYKDATGKVSGVFVAARDAAERYRLEHERALLASVVASATDAIYSYRPDTVVTSWNEGAERLYGYTAAEMIGCSAALCVPLERRAELLEHIKRVMRKEGIQRFETERRRKDGSLAESSVAMSPIIDRNGEVSGIASIASELGERHAPRGGEIDARLRRSRRRANGNRRSTRRQEPAREVEGKPGPG
jgi:PAS domain S-box-containing protein